MTADEVLDKMGEAIYDERRQSHMMPGWFSLSDATKQCYRHEAKAAVRAFWEATHGEACSRVRVILSLLGVEP